MGDSSESSQEETYNTDEEEQKEEAELSGSENEDLDLEASATESDDDSATESDDNSATESDNNSVENIQGNEEPPKSKTEYITENILQKYQERYGKQLYIRFPHKLPEQDDELQQKTQTLCSLIVKTHRPRQKHARFCLVDFDSKEDRDNALESIRKSAEEEIAAFKGVVASIPRTENAEFLKKLAERKLKSLENKKAKARLKRASKVAMRTKNFTSSIVVLNLPKSTSLIELRKLFPNAVDIQIKPGKGKMSSLSVGAITLPSTLEARAAVKQKLSLGGTKLNIRFDAQHAKKKQKRTHKIKRNMDKETDITPLQGKKSSVKRNIEKQQADITHPPGKKSVKRNIEKEGDITPLLLGKKTSVKRNIDKEHKVVLLSAKKPKTEKNKLNKKKGTIVPTKKKSV